MTDSGEQCREDEVASVLFCSPLTPETLEGIKSRLLGIAGKQLDCPDTDRRLGLARICLTTPEIEDPSPEEMEAALPRVFPLWTQQERVRAAVGTLLEQQLHLFGLKLLETQPLCDDLVKYTQML